MVVVEHLRRRRLAVLALGVGVLAVHALGVNQLATLAPGTQAMIQRITLAYVRPLQPQEPVPVAVPPARLKTWRMPAAGPAASAPAALAVDIAPAEATALAPLTQPQFDALPTLLPPFEWPPSTRLSYLLQGHYRGPLEGSAQVHWVRVGSRYQVQMDVVVGLAIAPLMSRRVTSDGELHADGLAPRRYEERTRFGPAAPTLEQLRFDDHSVVLGNGRRARVPPGVQDSASQFVQLAWLFNTQPQRLRAGERIELALALPRRVGNWVYEVQPEEWVQTPLGPLAAHALKPQPGAARPGELAVQMWIAPSLQYLPVRIRIEQGEQMWIDLLLESAPMQEAAGS